MLGIFLKTLELSSSSTSAWGGQHNNPKKKHLLIRFEVSKLESWFRKSIHLVQTSLFVIRPEAGL